MQMPKMWVWVKESGEATGWYQNLFHFSWSDSNSQQSLEERVWTHQESTWATPKGFWTVYSVYYVKVRTQQTQAHCLMHELWCPLQGLATPPSIIIKKILFPLTAAKKHLLCSHWLDNGSSHRQQCSTNVASTVPNSKAGYSIEPSYLFGTELNVSLAQSIKVI